VEHCKFGLIEVDWQGVFELTEAGFGVPRIERKEAKTLTEAMLALVLRLGRSTFATDLTIWGESSDAHWRFAFFSLIL